MLYPLFTFISEQIPEAIFEICWLSWSHCPARPTTNDHRQISPVLEPRPTQAQAAHKKEQQTRHTTHPIRPVDSSNGFHECWFLSLLSKLPAKSFCTSDRRPGLRHEHNTDRPTLQANKPKKGLDRLGPSLFSIWFTHYSFPRIIPG